MKFSNLKSGISMRDSAEPSIQVALELIDSLLKDIKAESGADIYSAPLGDESMSTSLARLCRTLNKIYESKSDELVRNRERLESEIEKLRATERELDEKNEGLDEKLKKLNEVKKQKAEAENNYEKLRSEYEIAVKDQIEYESILSETGDLKGRIADLKNFDKDKALKELEELKQKKSEIERNIEETRSQLDAAAEDNKRAEEDGNALSRELGKLREEKLLLENEQIKLASDITGTRNGIVKLSEEKKALEAENEALITEATACGNDIKILKEKRDSLADISNKAKAEVESLKNELNVAESEKVSISARLKQINDDKDRCIRDKAAIEISIKDAETKLKEREDELNTKKQENSEIENRLESIEAEISGLTGILESTQDEINKAEEEKENAAGFVESAKENLLQLEAELTGFEALKKETEDEVAGIREKTDAVNLELGRLNEEKDALTEQFTNSSKEIDSLRSLLSELKGKTDEEKLTELKNQLQKEIDHYKDVMNGIVEADESIRHYEEDIEVKEAILKERTDSKNQLETAEGEIKAKIKELDWVDTAENKERLIELRSRLELVIKVRENLAEAISRVNKAMGKNTDSPDISIGMKIMIANLEGTMAELQRRLIECSDSLSKEIRRNEK